MDKAALLREGMSKLQPLHAQLSGRKDSGDTRAGRTWAAANSRRKRPSINE